MLDICGMPVGDSDAYSFPPTLTQLGIQRNNFSTAGFIALLSTLPDLFYLNIDASVSGRRLRLSNYAEVFTFIREEHPNVRIIECSGTGVEITDEIYNIASGWHWLHGRSRRG
jgi:hypothetical protein